MSLWMPREPNNRDNSLDTTCFLGRMGPTYGSRKKFLCNMLPILLVLFEWNESASLWSKCKTSPDIWNVNVESWVHKWDSTYVGK